MLLTWSILPGASTRAQDSPPPPAFPTVNSSVVITTGNTFQTVLAAIAIRSNARRSLTIQNNNTTTDNCWLYLGLLASATEAKSILLQPGQAYQRYYPYVPADAVNVTCASTSDTVYVDNQ